MPTLPPAVASKVVEVAVKVPPTTSELFKWAVPLRANVVPGVVVPTPTLPSNWLRPLTVRTLVTDTLSPTEVAKTEPLRPAPLRQSERQLKKRDYFYTNETNFAYVVFKNLENKM
jgi:hypothetical protein